jgi:hypothetical protein
MMHLLWIQVVNVFSVSSNLADRQGGAANRLRGKTETLEKMRAHVQYDIDSVRNGLLGFGLMIIAVAGRDQNAH